ncbi:YceG family protein [Solibaculum mannosilyticum]|uniref:Putative component of 'biosynthetic module' domain-containing protein n=1 Tax=Solibaculum mannosilyticum TaxID=2780922 RepID=A0A7I8D8J7_9FIRM|nr:YceG family protein [Solibaculum mannosilyticum]BCI60954.1 hypothetical protein C12CBH8_15930 [Solibaculum mannosilyticum]
MLKRLQLQRFEDFLKPLKERPQPGVYFCRIAGYNPEVQSFLEKVLGSRKQNPLLVTGKLPNPDENQLSYFREMLGTDFSLDPGFFDQALRKWLPRLDQVQRETMIRSLCQTMLDLRAAGKTDNMLKNAYIKFMCWMYYRFEQILHKMGKEPLPKILYDGVLSAHELQMFCVLSDAGCDIALLEPQGDASYLKLDPESKHSNLFPGAGNGAFPPDFSLQTVAREAEQKQKIVGMCQTSEGNVPLNSTNTWLTGDLTKDSLKPPAQRGSEKNCFYNMFVRIRGVEEKSSYVKELFLWKKHLEEKGRKVLVLESLPIPTAEEVARAGRCNVQTAQQVVVGLLPALRPTANARLDGIIRSAFSNLILELAKENEPVNRIKNRAVYLVCWFNRYFDQLLKGIKEDSIPVFLYFNVCKTAFEALFLRFLARLPVDVLEIYPEDIPCCLEDRVLFDRNYPESLHIEKFPVSMDDAGFTTVAYHAEQELTETLYQDSGMYRTRQYHKASALPLKTMYEEIAILWDQEATFRPGFEVVDDTVLVPVITAKVCGVKNGDVGEYWSGVRKLLGENTLLISSCPHWNGAGVDRSFQPVSLIKNKRLERQKIKDSPGYAYSLLREETQELILDKIQKLLDSGLIKGTFSQGMEYKILAVTLHLDQDIIRMIQRFDFTKKNPKVVVINTRDTICSLEDSIVLAFLHLVGFDVVLFVPTGYQIIEKYYTGPLFTEHQIGDYLYDMQVPAMSSGMTAPREGIFSRFFRRSSS